VYEFCGCWSQVKRTEVVEGDLRTLGLQKDDALDKKKWRRLLYCADSDSWDTVRLVGHLGTAHPG